MWEVKVAHTTEKVTEALKAGFEPFAVIQPLASVPAKIYLKKQTNTRAKELKVKVELDTTEFNSIMQNLQEKILAMGTIESVDIVSILNYQKQNLEQEFRMELDRVRDEIKNIDPSGSLLVSPTTANINDEDDLNAVGRNEDEDYLQELEQKADEDLRKIVEGDVPAGDSYRVIDDIPELPKTRTDAQEQTIKKMRELTSINLTVTPPIRGGFIQVLEGSLIHTIAPDGTWETEENTANTTSL